MLKRLTQLALLTFLLSSCVVFRPKHKLSPQKTLISTARSYLGTPYRLGGTESSGIDCSGLLLRAFEGLNITLPRVSWQQAEKYEEISREKAKPGDLVFFVTGAKGAISHSGIITEVNSDKEIKFIHASSSKGVREDNLLDNYWIQRLAKITRPII